MEKHGSPRGGYWGDNTEMIRNPNFLRDFCKGMEGDDFFQLSLDCELYYTEKIQLPVFKRLIKEPFTENEKITVYYIKSNNPIYKGIVMSPDRLFIGTEEFEKIIDSVEFLENELVFYEVPELGIKFKVTPDSVLDLKYNIKNHEIQESNSKIKSAFFYSSSQTDKNLSNCKLSEQDGWDCGFFQIMNISNADLIIYVKQFKKEWCVDTGGEIILENNNGKYCLYKPESNFENDFDYRELFDISDEKKEEYGIFLNTIEQLS